MGEARSAYIYWSDFDGGDIRRANLDGTGQKILFTGLSNPVGPALDLAGGKMYWGNAGSNLRRANLDGSSQESLVQNLNAPSGIALDVTSGHIYWTEYGGGTIQRSNLDGTGKTNLITGLSGPTVIALDLSDPSPPNITRATKVAGTFTLSWSALMGRGYQVQFKSDLAQTNWTNSGGPRTATNTTMTASSNVGSDPQRFHRVVRLP